MSRAGAAPAGGFVRDYVLTMRPYLGFVSAIAGVAGLALAPPVGRGSTLLLGIVFFLAYGFGQALTDCFQVDTDALSAPYRPLVRGRVRRRDVLAVSAAGLLACGGVLAEFARVNAGLAALAALGLATYTPFKAIWWAGPFYGAWIVVVVAVMGYAAGAEALAVDALRSPWGAGTLVAVFFGYANFVVTGYYKDVSADRATGYLTLPVVLGPRASAAVSDVLALGAVAGAGAAVHGRAGAGGAAWAFLAAGAAATLLGQVRLHAVREESEAHRAIAPALHGYVLLLAGVAAAGRPGWAPALLLFCAAFAAALRRRPVERQI